MNSIIKEQVDSCTDLEISPYDESSTHIVIQKRTDYIYVTLKDGHQYIVELEDYLLFPPQDSSLHANWNNNIKPTDKYMQILVKQSMGSMVSISGYGYDKQTNTLNNVCWQGWVPIKSLKIIKEI